jgi:putative tryptophan/tyrosine transport system substrate-binding protein
MSEAGLSPYQSARLSIRCGLLSQEADMRRREFIGALGGAAAWPVMTRAQQPAMPTIGFLHSGSAKPFAERLVAFRQGLRDADVVEGKDFQIDFRWAEGNYERLREMASDLVARNVAVIVAGGGTVSAPVAKTATSTIPIVFIIASDPIATGLVTSLARPEANITGVSFLSQELGAKRLGFLNLLTPKATAVAVLVNPLNPRRDAAIKEIQDAASTSKRNIHIFEASTTDQIDSAFEAIVRQRFGAIMVHSDPFFSSNYIQIAARGTGTAIPTIYASREYVQAGGLMSYGADFREEYHKAGTYAGRILRGAKPTDLPIIQPTKFELVINLKTARSMGLKIPDSFQLLADEVIE